MRNPKQSQDDSLWPTALLLTLAVASTLPAQRPALAAALDACVRKAAIDQFAASVLVARDGEVVLHRGYGGARPDTLWDVASVSKQLTAAAILQLELRSRLRVHDTLDRFFDDLPADKAGITLHHLLTHTSGLPSEVRLTAAERDDRDAMLARVWREPLRFKPGDAFAYSNTGYNILAAIIATVGRRGFEGWLTEHVFQPAGMRDSGFLSDPALDADRAAPRWEDPADREYRDTAIAWPWHWAFRGATGIVTTVADLYAWDRALHAGHVLPPHVQAKLYRPRIQNYGYGWVSNRTDRGSRKLMHDGRTYGFRSVLARYPEEDAAIIIAANARSNVRELEIALERTLFDAGAPAARLDACAGRYRLPGGDEFDLVRRGARLLLHPIGVEASSRFLYGKAWSDKDSLARRSFAARARRLLRPLTHGPARKIGLSFSDASSPESLERITARFRELRRAHGAWRATRVAGSDPDTQSTYFHIQFGDTTVTWCATWDDDGSFASLRPTNRRFPLEAELRWRHSREFALRSADGLVALRLQFSGDGAAAATELLWTDAGNPTGSALDCARK